MLAVCLAFFVILLDSSIVNLALVRMQEALKTDLRGLQWVVDGYALVFASLLLTGGSLADKLAPTACSWLGFPFSPSPRAFAGWRLPLAGCWPGGRSRESAGRCCCQPR